jgi:hypothetical protein
VFLSYEAMVMLQMAHSKVFAFFIHSFYCFHFFSSGVNYTVYVANICRFEGVATHPQL